MDSWVTHYLDEVKNGNHQQGVGSVDKIFESNAQGLGSSLLSFGPDVGAVGCPADMLQVLRGNTPWQIYWAGLTVHTNQAKWNPHKQESDKHDDPPVPIFDLENIEEGIERTS
ncbi:unnamed protein product [Camellia sinensis]